MSQIYTGANPPIVQRINYGIEIALLGRVMNLRMFQLGDAVVWGIFLQAEAAGEVHMPYDGCQLVGGKLVETAPGQIGMRWRTAFYPAPRWRGQEGEVSPLGFFEGVDLYWADQLAPMSPTLIGRTGHKGGDYATHNPVMMGQPLEGLHERWAVEAFERALALGFPLMHIPRASAWGR